jgi:hypothetical protein
MDQDNTTPRRQPRAVSDLSAAMPSIQVERTASGYRFRCPYCSNAWRAIFHHHGRGLGHRVSHCPHMTCYVLVLEAERAA